MKKGFLALIVSLFLAVFLVGQVYGWGIDYAIEPNHEVTETIPLTPSSSVIGNVSANGLVDFYVSSPSSEIVYCSNETAFTSFSFTANEDGNYTLHIVNNDQTENVTATLSYSKHLVVNLYSTMTMTLSTATVTTTSMIVTPTPFDWIGVISAIGSISGTILSGIGIIKALEKFLGWFRWWRKYKKSRTPVVIQVLLALFKKPLNPKNEP